MVRTPDSCCFIPLNQRCKLQLAQCSETWKRENLVRSADFSS